MLFIEGRCQGYAPDQIRNTMTVQELINFLEQFDGDTEVMIQRPVTGNGGKKLMT